MSSRRLAFKILVVNAAVVAAAIGLHLLTRIVAPDDTFGTVFFALMLILIATLVSVYFARHLTQNITVLTDAASRISQGDLSHLVKFDQQASAAEEVDSLAEAINHMLENLRELVSHLQKTARHIASSANTLSAAAENVTSANNEVASSVNNIARSAELQNELVGKAGGLMTEIASGIERSSSAVEAAARAEIGRAHV